MEPFIGWAYILEIEGLVDEDLINLKSGCRWNDLK